MNTSWLSHPSFEQAVRWALLWPAFVIALLHGAASYFAFMYWRGNWGFAIGVESLGPIPVWLGVTITGIVVLIGPSALFLGLWRLVRR